MIGLSKNKLQDKKYPYWNNYFRNRKYLEETKEQQQIDAVILESY